MSKKRSGPEDVVSGQNQNDVPPMLKKRRLSIPLGQNNAVNASQPGEGTNGVPAPLDPNLIAAFASPVVNLTLNPNLPLLSTPPFGPMGVPPSLPEPIRTLQAWRTTAEAELQYLQATTNSFLDYSLPTTTSFSSTLNDLTSAKLLSEDALFERFLRNCFALLIVLQPGGEARRHSYFDSRLSVECRPSNATGFLSVLTYFMLFSGP